MLFRSERHADRPDDHLAWREITDEVMFEIRELSGQEYRNTYASKKPETLHAPTAVVSTQDNAGRNTSDLETSAP